MRTVCSRCSAVSLVSQGLFPCAPNRPSLAVDLHALEVVQDMSVRNNPNVAAWADMLENFFRGQGYNVGKQVRRRY